jgi:FAD/FMN-containing dehydrogenase
VRLRQEIADLHEKMGSVHQQIGKYYAFGANLDPHAWELLTGIKRLVDPKGLMNPGALGLH